MDSIVQIEDFLIDTSQLIGQGACGKVFNCTKKNSNLQLCAKVVTANSQNVSKELEILNFMKEKQNENIVNVFFASRVHDQNYTVIIMEKCDSDLEKEIKQRKQQQKKFTEQEVMEIMRQLFNGYKVLYQSQIIHRDIKPANILTQNGKYKLADFGVGKIYEADSNLQNVTKSGTPVFKAPELQGNYEWLPRDLGYLGIQQQNMNFVGAVKPQFSFINPEEKQKIHHKMDIYSFGILLYHLLTDSYPFELNMAAISNFVMQLKYQPFKIPPTLQVSPQTQNLLERMITYSPFDRIGFVEISQQLGFRLGTFFNRNDFSVPVQRFGTQSNNQFQKIQIIPQYKPLQEWLANLRILFLERCNENPLVMRAYRNYCDLCLQLASLVLENNCKIQTVQEFINQFQSGNQKNDDIKITMEAQLDKYFYIKEFTTIIKGQFVPHIFNYEGARVYSESHLKFMYYYFKLVHDLYNFKNINQNASQIYIQFKDQYTKDTALTKELLKNFLDSNY